MSDLFPKPTEDDLKTPVTRAKFSGLVKLPAKVKGTTCDSCEYFDGQSECHQREVEQKVNATRQCCSYYDCDDLESVVGKEI